MTEKICIQGIIPYFQNYYLINQFDNAINEIKNVFNSEQFEIPYLDKVKFKFNQSDESDIILKHKYLFKEHIPLNSSCFIISFEADLDTTKCIVYKEKNKENDIESAKFFIANSFAETIYKLFFISNIAKPGCITIYQGIVIFNDKKYHDIDGIYPFLEDAYSQSLKLKYQECFYKFSDIYNLIEDIGYDFYNEPENQLTIAINCLTYILSFELNNFERLMYCMIGLEAIYTKGNVGILEQLNDKIQIYLGQLIDYKKIIKEMYSIRSRYLHGDTPIRPYFVYGNTNETIYEKNIYDALSISSILLIRTIQKMLLEGKTELNFKYKLV
jgi:hypothetical protein